MTRIISLAAALVTSAMLLTATAGHAEARGYYTAAPVAAPAKGTLIASNTLWSCDGGVCVAKKAGERDAIVCERVAKHVGTLSSFTANGAAFDAEALAKCNTKAK